MIEVSERQWHESEELGNKLAAEILLRGTITQRGIVIPSEDEWHGIGALERDDELVRKSEEVKR